MEENSSKNSCDNAASRWFEGGLGFHISREQSLGLDMECMSGHDTESFLISNLRLVGTNVDYCSSLLGCLPETLKPQPTPFMHRHLGKASDCSLTSTSSTPNHPSHP